MNDIEIIEQALNEGKEGITVSDSHLLVPMRITGTGTTKRHLINSNGERVEFDLERPIDEFTSDKFLKSCVGLPVTMFHPKDDDGKINFENYHDHIIGNIIYPYVKGDEVWGYAKIHDLKLLDALESGINSTSPMVISKNYVDDDGKLKEEFQDINHIAIVVKGRWDTDKPAIVDDIINNIGEIKMDEKEKVDNIANVEQTVEKTADKVDKKCDDSDLMQADVNLDKQLIEINTKLLSAITDLTAKLSAGAPKTDEVVAPIPAEAVTPVEVAPAPVVEAEEKKDEDDIVDEKDAKEKEDIANKIAGLSDMADAEMKIVRPVAKQGEKASNYLNRFLKLNKEKVDSKYHCLLEKVDGSTLELGKEALASLEMYINKEKAKKDNEANKSGYVQYPDGRTEYDLLRRVR